MPGTATPSPVVLGGFTLRKQAPPPRRSNSVTGRLVTALRSGGFPRDGEWYLVHSWTSKSSASSARIQLRKQGFTEAEGWHFEARSLDGGSGLWISRESL